MANLTNNPRILFNRLADYLGAEWETYGETLEIHDFGTGTGLGALGPLRIVGRHRWWSAVAHMLLVATTLEKSGGMGCTWEGLYEAAGYAFERRHYGCKVTRLATQPCPRCGDDGGTLELPVHMGANADAMMCRLSEPEFFDYMMDRVADRAAGWAA